MAAIAVLHRSNPERFGRRSSSLSQEESHIWGSQTRQGAWLQPKSRSQSWPGWYASSGLTRSGIRNDSWSRYGPSAYMSTGSRSWAYPRGGR